MTIKKCLHDTRIIFSLLQIIAVAAMVCGTLLALCLGYVGVALLIRYIAEARFDMLPFVLICLPCVAAVSALCYVAIISFFNMCRRLKTGTAFTQQNTRAMKRIALCSLGVGLCLIFTDALVLLTSFLLSDPAFHLADVYLMGISLIFLLVALVAWTLYLLLDRATAIQQENDLTI